MRNLTTRIILTVCALLCFCGAANAQGVAVAPLTLPRTQFLSSTGVPIAAGCVNFFATGTSTPQAIYADSGGVNQLANPLTLDAAGEASVWMSNTGYDIVLNAGVFGTACSVSLGSQLWVEKNKNPFSIINSGSNYIVASGTSDPAGSAGELAYRTDIPCFRGFTTLWDCFTQNAAVQALSNKTMQAPFINGGTQNAPAITLPVINAVTVVNSPGTYINVAASVIGTVANRLTKLVGAPSTAQTTATTDASGAIGITVLNAGGTGTTSTIQQSGLANCFFDNATTAGDYVTISALTGGSCHDAGATPPQGPQTIGQVLSTNVFNAATPFQIELFPPGIVGGAPGASVGCTLVGTGTNTITNNNAQQSLISCTIPANVLSAGSMLNVTVTGIESTAAGQTITFTTSLGGGTSCSSQSGGIGVANNQPFQVNANFSVLTAGAGGTANLYCSSSFSAGAGIGFVAALGVVGAPTISVNTTIPNVLLIQVQMSVANAGNSTSAQLLKAIIY